ncbi:MAG: cytochrome d ubiquinol oxidase subunit II [Desulfovibrionaceae bacterium]|nr:cytochrome d ubiquinol oxidase subunit II [Desulfovibrionaceae bacterium]
MLETIWFILWALLWAVYFILDGFDLGIGSLLPFAARNEGERRIMFNATGPFWDGNEVWLIAAGGVTFAAFPKTYAVMFSALYVPLLLLLFMLIFRAVSYEFRNKIEHPGWRTLWDLVHFVTNLVAAVLLGVAFANLFMGIPIDAEGLFHGSLVTFLNPYGLAGGVFFLVMFSLHGALWLCFKTHGYMQERALAFVYLLWPLTAILLLAFLLFTAFFTDLFVNYVAMPALFLIPLVAVAGLVGILVMLRLNRILLAWVSSCLFIVGVTFFGVMGMFPRMLISSKDAAATLTCFNSASSELTLTIMLGVALVMVPIVLVYQFWAYRLFSHKLDEKDIMTDSHAY